MEQHGSTSALDMVDIAAQMAKCKQRCFSAQACPETVKHTGYPSNAHNYTLLRQLAL